MSRSSGAILVALNELRRLSTGELREKFVAVFGEPTHSRNRSYLLRKIAAELQGAASAPTPPAAQTKPPRPTGTRDPRLPPVGTVLERLYGNDVVRATVLDDGFEYAGKTYRSLSAIARAATGTAWNGLMFFRLTR